MKEYLEKYMTPLFEDEINKGCLGGASLWIKKGEETVYKKHFGTDRDGLIYRVFSMTKPVTSVCAFILYERGQLDLWKPLKDYLPSFSSMKVIDEKGKLHPCTKDILIRDLLNMTSGIVYPGIESPAEMALGREVARLKKRRQKGEDVTAEEVEKIFASAPLAFEPGKMWKYGASADVLGMVIEKISGMTLGEFMKKELFEPLEMKDSGFSVSPENKDRIATMYGLSKGGAVKPVSAEKLSSLFAYPDGSCRTIEAGGSGLYVPMEDYMHFVDMLAENGTWKGRRILGRKTVEFIRTPQLNDEQYRTVSFESAWGYSYSNLMRILVDKGAGGGNGSIGEFGWDGLAGTYMMIDPERDIRLVYMQQVADGGDESVRRRMRAVLYAADED